MAMNITNSAIVEGKKFSRNIWLDGLRRLSRNKAAVVSFLFILFMVFVAIFADVVAPYSPYESDLYNIRSTPTRLHWLGTDEIGRDLLSRLIYGARISLFIGLTVQILTTTIGIFIGMLAGYYGGLFDMILMRFVDIMYAFPSFLFAVFMVSLLEPNTSSVILTLVLSGWPFSARLVRGQVLSIKKMEFITATKVLGVKKWRVMFKHILPNILTPLIIQFSMGIAGVIMAEAGLSFLGIGIRPPNPTWGGMINKGKDFIRSSPHLAIYPSIVLGLMMIAFNFLGDGLRDALDPRLTD